MSHVLARKWRPRNFQQLVGQQHISKALCYALDNNRVHHAYLFTGTRGVGKTTIARILAKSLNCLNSTIKSQPCCQCSNCREIDNGCFSDLIEIDAASRTRVEETLKILANVPYAPLKGAYKVYLIDEVHMFSNNSFNALLKTLEEPPAHVKFILATTEIQKLPATLLSRCLLFYLKNLRSDDIANQLRHVLDHEQITFEDNAIITIANCANGSMRDALSLLDQAIAYGQGQLRAAEVTTLLGLVDEQLLRQLLTALTAANARQMRQTLATIDNFAPDYAQLLQDILKKLQQLTIIQLDAQLNYEIYDDFYLQLAAKLPTELLQLWYQIASETYQNLPYQPNYLLAIEMCLLRMIAFYPQNIQTVIDNYPDDNAAAQHYAQTAQWLANAEDNYALAQIPLNEVENINKNNDNIADNDSAPIALDEKSLQACVENAQNWEKFLQLLAVDNDIAKLSSYTCPASWQAPQLLLFCDSSALLWANDERCHALADKISNAIGRECRVSVEESTNLITPLILTQQRQQKENKEMQQLFNNHPLVTTAREQLGAAVIENSIHKIAPQNSAAKNMDF